MTVTDPVPSFFVSESSVTIDQGETTIIDITSGGGSYLATEYDTTLVFVDADTDSNNLTGDIEITGREPGTTQVVVQDHYYQEQKVQVTIRDTILRLSVDTLEISGTNFEYVSTLEAHTGIERVEQDNNHVTSSVITLEDGERVVKVLPVSAGETTLTVYDYEGNTDTVVVTVNGGAGGSDGGSGSGSTGTGSEVIEFSDFLYDTTIQSNFQPIYFELSGSPDEVGVEIRGDQNFVQQEALELSPDGKYFFALGKKDSFSHLDVVPYYKDAQGNVHYYNNLIAVDFNGISVATADEISTASTGNEVYAYFVDLGVGERFSQRIAIVVDNLAEVILDQLAPVCKYYSGSLKTKCREGYLDGSVAELEAMIDFIQSFPTTREQIGELISYLKQTYNAAVEYGQNLVENVGQTYANAREYFAYLTSNLSFISAENGAYLNGFVGATIVFGSIGVGKLKVGDRIRAIINKFLIIGKAGRTKSLLTSKGLTLIAKPAGYKDHGSAYDSSSLSAGDKLKLQEARLAIGSNDQGQKGEEFFYQLTNHLGDDLDIGSSLGMRKVDAYDGSSKTLYEVKNYRNLVGSSDSTHNGLEIKKDAELLIDGTHVKQAVWVFLDKGPNSSTIDRLENAGIEYILIQ